MDDVEAGRAPLIAMVLIPLMKRGEEPGMIQRWLTRAGWEPDAQLRADLGFALTFAEAAGREEVWQEALRGWNVIESKVLRGWVRELVEHERQNARVQTKADAVLELLAARGAVPPDLAEAVRAVTEVTRLSELHLLADGTATVEEFRQRSGL
jgi:hypothetical protein